MDGPNSFEQPNTVVNGSLWQAARDIITAPISKAFDWDTSLLIHGADIVARFLLVAYATYRLGYSRGLARGHSESDRRQNGY